MASKLTLWINQKLKDKGISAKDAQKDAGKYKSIAAAKKKGSLYYTDKNGKVKIAAYAEEVQTMKTPPARPKPKPKVSAKDAGKGANVKITVTPKAKPKGITDDAPLGGGGKASNIIAARKGPSFEGKGRGTPPAPQAEKRDPSKRIQALKGVSNAKLASRIRAKLNDPSFRKSRGLNTLKNSLEATLKIDTSSLRGERMQKMRLDSLLSKVDRMMMNTGGAVKKKKMALGGMMDDKKINPSTGLSMSMGGLGRKVNPSTGLSMKKGGMVDYRKSGMFYGGGMARKV